jgi:multidrug efflux pump subunit AcrA (membrane-fusion protein)
LAGVAAVLLTAASCGGDGTGVGIGAAGRADVTEVVDASASVTARSVATLSAPADGTVAALSVNSGQQVAAGQVLAVIDSPTAQQRLKQARVALDALDTAGGGVRGTDLSGQQRRTDAAAAETFARAREAAGRIGDPAVRDALLAQLAAAQQAYREVAASARAVAASVEQGLASVAQATAALTAAQRAQAQAAYDLAATTVDALTLRAPTAGVVQFGGVGTPGAGATGSLTDLLGAASGAGAAGAVAGAAAGGPGVDPAPVLGTRISAGGPVLTIVDTSELGLLAEVDETDVLLVQPGVGAEVELDAVPGARYRATLNSVDMLPSTSAQGGVSYRARLALAAGAFPDQRAAPVPRPGMSAIAHLAVRSASDAVTVPAAAVFNADGRDAVWLVRAGKAERVPVTVGVAGQDLVQIVTGVAAGDRLVVSGVDRVRPGQRLP